MQHCRRDTIVRLLIEAEGECDAQEAAMTRALTLNAVQRKNILQMAIAGRLVPQNTKDEPAAALFGRIRAKHAEREEKPKARTTGAVKTVASMMNNLLDVLAEAADWVPAQEAFRRCGIADGAQTRQIEAVYAELRELDKSGRLAVEAVCDTQGRKLYDRLKLVPVT